MAAVGLQDAPGSRRGPGTELLGMLMLGAPGAEARAKFASYASNAFQMHNSQSIIEKKCMFILFYVIEMDFA